MLKPRQWRVAPSRRIVTRRRAVGTRVRGDRVRKDRVMGNEDEEAERHRDHLEKNPS